MILTLPRLTELIEYALEKHNIIFDKDEKTKIPDHCVLSFSVHAKDGRIHYVEANVKTTTIPTEQKSFGTTHRYPTQQE